jgi:hypothetical protein
MNAKDLLESMTGACDGPMKMLFGNTSSTTHPITIFFSEGSNPSRVAQRTMIVDGRKFLVQVISLSENY